MKIVFTFLLALMTTGFISAQTLEPVILKMEVEPVQGTNEVISKLLVSNFKNIRGYQFSSRWFPGELLFMEVEHFGPDEMEMSQLNFGTHLALWGSIGTSWSSIGLGGLTLADDTELFAFRFKKIWGDGRFSIENHPVKIEFFDNNYNILDLVFIDNFGDVSYYKNGILSSTENLESDKISIFPNPAKDRIFFKWDHMNQVPDQAIIYSLNGQLIGQRTITDQSIELPESLVPGTYLLMLQKAGETVAVKKVQVQH